MYLQPLPNQEKGNANWFPAREENQVQVKVISLLVEDVSRDQYEMSLFTWMPALQHKCHRMPSWTFNSWSSTGICKGNNVHLQKPSPSWDLFYKQWAMWTWAPSHEFFVHQLWFFRSKLLCNLWPITLSCTGVLKIRTRLDLRWWILNSLMLSMKSGISSDLFLSLC